MRTQINIKHHTWHILLNPNALSKTSSRFWTVLEEKFKEVQIDYHRHVTSTVDGAKSLITALCKGGGRHFVIVGGDGSVNVFVDAVMKSQVDSSEIYAAVIPLGTGNDWSRSHGYANRPLNAVDSLINGYFISHDAGLVETIVNGEVTDVRYFVNIAGFGFDGAVIANASKKSTKFFHKQLYLINLLKTLLGYKSQLVTLKSPEITIKKDIFTIAAGIGQYNGNGMRQCPEAIPNDGLLDVVMIEKVSVFKVLLNIKNLFNGSHVKKLKEVSMMRTNYLEICATPFILGEVEGETLAAGDYRIRCLDSAINFMRPAL